MRSINAAYRVLADPNKRAMYDGQRYVSSSRATVATRPRPRPVVVASAPPPTQLQRRVDRIVAVVGVCLLIGIGIYAVLLIPHTPPQSSRVSVNDRVRVDTGLRSFPGTVLVPPSTLEPFAGLPLLRIDATGQGIARYAVYYGDLTTGAATVSGLIGRASFEAAAPSKIEGCAAEATYCRGPAPGQSASDAAGLEIFRDPDLIPGDPAFATHRVCCNGLFWSLSWYDAATNMSYTIDLSRNVAAQFGGSDANGDTAAARRVAALANQLVRLP